MKEPSDIEKAFAYQDEGLEETREFARKQLPKLKKLIEDTKDRELMYFVQEAVDCYMMNVCRLGRR